MGGVVQAVTSLVHGMQAVTGGAQQLATCPGNLPTVGCPVMVCARSH